MGKRVSGADGAGILVADDNEDLLALASDILASAGYRVTTAVTGEEALERVTEDRSLSVLLTDIRMPGAMDGWELAERARALRPTLHVIYMTGFTEVSPIRPGHGPLLPKPWRAAQLLDCIRHVLGGDRSARP